MRAASPRESPAETTPTSVKVIGTITVLSPAIYNVSDTGDASCRDGSPGRAFHLTPKKANSRYQLTDVVVQTASLRFCTIRFSAAGAGTGIYGGFYEQHYAEIGGYRVVTDGLLDGIWPGSLVRPNHGIWRFRYRDLAFPMQLPDDVFES